MFSFDFLRSQEDSNGFFFCIEKDFFPRLIEEDGFTFLLKSFDIVITLCGDANDSCVNLNTLVKQHIHWDIMDPAKFHGEEEAKRKVFRDVRELIKNNIKDLKENTV